MDINARFLEFALLGSSWVLWLLVGLSVVSVTIAAERALQFRAAIRGQQRLRAMCEDAWARVCAGTSTATDVVGRLVAHARSGRGPAARMLVARAAQRVADPHGVNAVRLSERRRLEQYLSLLGTVGANAPFVGLFGTVLEILRVFNGIGTQGFGSASQSMAIMSGISEALVATGVGLLVAIPAVVAFNAFVRRLDALASEADEVMELVAAIEATGGGDGRAVT